MRLLRQVTGTKASSLATALLMFALGASASPQKTQIPVPATQADLPAARQELAAKHYARAKDLYRVDVQEHPGSVDPQFGRADAELGLRVLVMRRRHCRRVVP